MIFLIPELCSVTGAWRLESSSSSHRFLLSGISEAMRRDFSLMKEMNVYTHVAPQQRVEQLNGFIGEIQRRDEAKKELSKWQIQLDEQLVQLQGRIIESEAIIYKDVRFFSPSTLSHFDLD